MARRLTVPDFRREVSDLVIREATSEEIPALVADAAAAWAARGLTQHAARVPHLVALARDVHGAAVLIAELEGAVMQTAYVRLIPEAW
jgi:hypothetical protein